MRAIRVAAVCLTQCVSIPAGGHALIRPADPARPFTVTHDDVVIEPDLGAFFDRWIYK